VIILEFLENNFPTSSTVESRLLIAEEKLGRLFAAVYILQCKHVMMG